MKPLKWCRSSLRNTERLPPTVWILVKDRIYFSPTEAIWLEDGFAFRSSSPKTIAGPPNDVVRALTTEG